MNTGDGPALGDRFALDASGTRFARAEIEEDYLATQYERTLATRSARAAVAIVLGGLWAAWFGLAVRERSAVVWLAMVVAVAVPALLIAVLRAPRRWFAPVALVGPVVWATVAVLVAASELPGSSVMLGVAVMYAPLILSNPYFRPNHLALAALPPLVVEVAVFGAQTSERAGLAGAVVVALAAVAGGYVSSRGAHRLQRLTYAQERIIDAQRATIAKQQAQLENELSHQVAERSRELGAVMARSDVTLDVRRLLPGERFAERYKVVKPLGAGGMGAVYEVERVTDGARLALKAVVGEVSGPSAARFAREAEIGARIRHPNVVPIVDVGVAGGVPYLVMELVPGGSLEAQRSRFGDVEWALPLLRQVADGLAALHEAGVVHRDLKPANVLLTAAGAKISDFGISRLGPIEDPSIDPSANTLAATPRKSAELTATNMVMGTPLYMAPEGAKTAKTLDASADAFALGIIAYEMITGSVPFAVPPFVLAMAEQPIPAPPPIEDSRVPETVRALLGATLDGDPAKRPRLRTLAVALAVPGARPDAGGPVTRPRADHGRGGS